MRLLKKSPYVRAYAVIGKGCERKRSWFNLRYCPGICLEGRKKAKKKKNIALLPVSCWNLLQVSRSGSNRSGIFSVVTLVMICLIVNQIVRHSTGTFLYVIAHIFLFVTVWLYTFSHIVRLLRFICQYCLLCVTRTAVSTSFKFVNKILWTPYDNFCDEFNGAHRMVLSRMQVI
jgi:hypothetical protein